jgi:hypothetical protein
MALPVIDHVYRCAVDYSVAGRPCTNVLHVEAASDPNPTAVALAVAEAWGEDTGLCLLQSTSVNLIGVEVTPLDGVTNSAAASFGVAENDNGKHSAFPMPAGDCLVLSLKSDTRGRSANGRMYLSGLCTNQLENDQQSWLSATISAAQAAWTQTATILEAEISGAIFVVASYKLEVAFPITSVTPRSFVASQRDRDH